jgi:hypothetical protein
MGYWGEVHRRAWRETLEMIRLDHPMRVVMMLITLAVPASIVWAQTANSESWVRALAALGGTALGGLFIYGYQLFAVPPKLASEAQELRDTLEARLATFEPQEADAPLEHALGYILTGTWGPDFPSDLSKVGAIFKQMQSLAYHGKIAIWGRQSDFSVMRAIEREFWEHKGIDLQGFFTPDLPTRTEKAHKDHQPYRFTHLMVIKAQIEREWPRSA